MACGVSRSRRIEACNEPVGLMDYWIDGLLDDGSARREAESANFVVGFAVMKKAMLKDLNRLCENSWGFFEHESG